MFAIQRCEAHAGSMLLIVGLMPETPHSSSTNPTDAVCGDALHGLGGRMQSRWLRTADGFAVSVACVNGKTYAPNSIRSQAILKCSRVAALLFEQAASIQDQQNQTLNHNDCGHPRDGKH